MFKISVFGLSSVFYTSCTKKEPYPFIGKTHKFKNLLNLMTLGISIVSAFYNRHKLMYVLNELINKKQLSKKIALDETYLTYQAKGL